MIGIPTYHPDWIENQCLPGAFASLGTAKNAAWWSARLGYTRPVQDYSWTDIGKGVPANWALYCYRAPVELVDNTNGSILAAPRLTVAKLADSIKTSAVLVIRSPYSAREDHAISVRAGFVYDPGDDTIMPIRLYPHKRRIVRYAWIKNCL